MRSLFVVVVVVTCLASPARAEFGASYGRGFESFAIDAKKNYDPNGFLGPEYGQNTVTLQTHRITLWDTNGWLAAIGGTAMNRHVAREAAIRGALIRGESSARYSYETVPPTPGYTTTLSLILGDSATGLSRNGVAVTGQPASMWGLWVQAGFANLELGPVIVGFSIDGGGYVASWKPPPGPGVSGIDPSFARIALQLAAQAQYPILPNLSLSLRLGVDPLLSPLRALLSGFSAPALDAGAAFAVQFRPIPWVMVFGEAVGAISAEFQNRGLQQAYAQVGLAVLLPIGED